MPTAVLALLAVMAGCGATSAAPPTVTPAAVAPSARSHVVVIVMENKEQPDVLRDQSRSYLARLARRSAVLTHSYGVTHPSLPNYLALTSGATHGIRSDCTDCHVRAPNIVTRLEAAHPSWKAYMEDLPRPCFTGAGAQGYAKKHDPFLYYDDVVADPARCRKVVPFAKLAGDLDADRLPAFAFISPNLCNDTHDCPVAAGDRFLAGTVPALLRGLGPHGFLVVTWDEGASSAGCCGSAAAGGGHIATVVAGPDVRPGARLATPIDHIGVLATIEAALGLAPVGDTADPRHGSFAKVFTRTPRIR
jgi:hypothetical protein